MKIDFDWLIMMPLSFLYIGIVFYYVKYKKRKVPYIIVFTLFFTYMAEVLKYTQFPICLNVDMEELNRQCVNYIPFHFLSIEDIKIFVLTIIITVPFGFLVSILYKFDWRKIIVSGILFGAITEADILEELGIPYEMTVISAHREPDVFLEYAKSAEEKGFKVIIAGAGMAAHLTGMCAAIFPMPVIGIPMHTTSLGGRDSLYSIVQMPSGIPVATVAINGGANAGLLAAKILATSDAELLGKLKAYSTKLKEQVEAKDAKLQEIGYKAYLEGMKK